MKKCPSQCRSTVSLQLKIWGSCNGRLNDLASVTQPIRVRGTYETRGLLFSIHYVIVPFNANIILKITTKDLIFWHNGDNEMTLLTGKWPWDLLVNMPFSFLSSRQDKNELRFFIPEAIWILWNILRTCLQNKSRHDSRQIQFFKKNYFCNVDKIEGNH